VALSSSNDGTGREELAAAIEATLSLNPICPVYQNVTAKAVSDPNEIKKI
jgi:[acyl-carrier-protein] S-malonyltransferase